MMISDANNSILLKQENRPETQKRSRGGKFHKTLTSFYPNENLELQGNSTLSQQQSQMNATGFNFRQNKYSEVSGRQKKQLQQQKQPISLEQQSQEIIHTDEQQLVMTESKQDQSLQENQGANKSDTPNTFTKGITLEEYFHTNANTEDGTSTERENTKQGTYQQSYQLSEIYQEDRSFQATNGQEKLANDEEKEEEDQNCYDQNAFEIHEESDEEEEEELEHRRKKKKKSSRQASSPKDISTIQRDNEGNIIENIENKRKNSEYLQKENDTLSSNSFDKSCRPHKISTNEQQEGQRNNKSNYESQRQQDNQELQRSHQESFEADDFIQRKIREKYFKNTIHKHITAVPLQASNNGVNYAYAGRGSNIASVPPSSSTSHNFYAQNSYPQQSNPSALMHGGNVQGSSAGRKMNRSQSPLQAFKRQSIPGNSQQRCVSKDVGDSMNSVDEEDRMRKTGQGSIRRVNQQLSQLQNLQNGIYQPYDSQATMENHIAFRSSFYSKGQVLTNPSYGAKQRLTVNDFYKNQGGKIGQGNYDEQMGQNQFQMQSLQQQNYQQQQAQLQRHPQNYSNSDYVSAESMIMHRAAKENKYLNQKDKIQEMAKEDDNFITKHAARFNLNPSELASIKHKN